MEQKVFKFFEKARKDGSVDLDKLVANVDIVKSDGWTIKQISTCSSCMTFPNQPSATYVYLFLLAEK